VGVVREHGARADEHAVREDGRLVDQRVVLHFARVAEHHASADVGTATHDAVATEGSTLANLREVPDG
jgi:hypothetical protein